MGRKLSDIVVFWVTESLLNSFSLSLSLLVLPSFLWLRRLLQSPSEKDEGEKKNGGFGAYVSDKTMGREKKLKERKKSLLLLFPSSFAFFLYFLSSQQIIVNNQLTEKINLKETAK